MIITRRSIVGYGYTSACENDERGNLRVCATTEPVHTGTIKQVTKQIEDDRTLASYNSGTYYSQAWFVRVDGKWRKIDGFYTPPALLDDRDGKYLRDSISVNLI